MDERDLNATLKAEDMDESMANQVDGNDSPPEETGHNSGGNASEPPYDSADLIVVEPNYESEPNEPSQSMSVLVPTTPSKSYIEAFSWALFRSSSGESDGGETEPGEASQTRSSSPRNDLLEERPSGGGGDSNEGDVDTTFYEVADDDNNNDEVNDDSPRGSFASQEPILRCSSRGDDAKDKDDKALGRSNFSFINKGGPDPFANQPAGPSGCAKKQKRDNKPAINEFESIDLFADTQSQYFSHDDLEDTESFLDVNANNATDGNVRIDTTQDSPQDSPPTADVIPAHAPKHLRQAKLVQKEKPRGRVMGPQYYSSTDDADESCVPGFVAARVERETDPTPRPNFPRFMSFPERDPVSFSDIF